MKGRERVDYGLWKVVVLAMYRCTSLSISQVISIDFKRIHRIRVDST